MLEHWDESKYETSFGGHLNCQYCKEPNNAMRLTCRRCHKPIYRTEIHQLADKQIKAKIVREAIKNKNKKHFIQLKD